MFRCRMWSGLVSTSRIFSPMRSEGFYKCTQQTGPAKLIKTPPSTCSTFSTCLHFLVMVIVYLLYLASESPWKPTAAISSRSVAAIALQTNKKEPLRLHSSSKQHTTACASVQFSFLQKKRQNHAESLHHPFVRQFFLFRIRPTSISLCSVRASAALARIASCFSNSAESPSNPPMAETNNQGLQKHANLKGNKNCIQTNGKEQKGQNWDFLVNFEAASAFRCMSFHSKCQENRINGGWWGRSSDID